MAVSVCSSRFFALNRQFVIKVLCVQQKVFVSNSKIEEIKSEAQKKPKRPIIPKITLISADNVSVTTLEEAQKLSKRRDLKLVKIIDVDTKTQRPVYKLMTGSEYHGEELKQREEKKKEKSKENAIKGEKVLMLSAGIGVNDLKVTANKIMKWMSKRYEARIIINGSSENMEKAESVYKFLEDNLKDHGRFLQKRTKGNDIKFSINPPKTSNKKEDDGVS